jgi:hypothetical protein
MGNFATQPEFATAEVASHTPSDTMDTTTFLDGAGVFVGTGGDLRVIMKNVEGSISSPDNSVTFTNIPDGTFLPIIVDYIIATNTTAAGIIVFK